MEDIVIKIKKQTLIYVAIATVVFLVGLGSRDLIDIDWQMPSFGETSQERIALMSGDVSLDDDPRLGSDDAKVKIVLFSEFDCPYSNRAVPVIKQIESAYGDNVVLAFRDFPLGFHATAQKAAEAGECADEQGMFWAYHDMLFETQGAHEVSDLKSYAIELGLDSAKFDECLDSGIMAEEVKADMAAGTAAGVSGTPTFIVNGEKVVGAQPFEVFKEKIDAALTG